MMGGLPFQGVCESRINAAVTPAAAPNITASKIMKNIFAGFDLRIFDMFFSNYIHIK
jgi:hypothetical protein